MNAIAKVVLTQITILLVIYLLFYMTSLPRKKISTFIGYDNRPMNHDNADNMGAFDNIDYHKPEFIYPINIHGDSRKHLRYAQDIESDYLKWLKSVNNDPYANNLYSKIR